MHRDNLFPAGIGSRTKIMGILNVNDDSFYANSRIASIEAALTRAMEMVEAGAEILDIGAESTRPGATGLGAEEEIAALCPVVESIRLALPDTPISVDTRKASVARAALQAGADIVNDVSGLELPEEADAMLDVLRAHAAHYILMHTKGTPDIMHLSPHYDDFWGELTGFFERKIELLTSKGVDRSRIILDPGIGFGKRVKDNLAILANLDALRQFGLPLLIGASRKGFIVGATHSAGNLPPSARLGGTVAVTTLCALHRVDIVRVHDVAENAQAVALIDAVGECGHD